MTRKTTNGKRCPSLTDLLLAEDGELSRDENDALWTHMRACASCTERWQRHEATVRRITTHVEQQYREVDEVLTRESVDERWTRFKVRLEAHKRARRRETIRKWAVAAMVVFLVGGAVTWAGGLRKAVTKVLAYVGMVQGEPQPREASPSVHGSAPIRPAGSPVPSTSVLTRSTTPAVDPESPLRQSLEQLILREQAHRLRPMSPFERSPWLERRFDGRVTDAAAVLADLRTHTAAVARRVAALSALAHEHSAEDVRRWSRATRAVLARLLALHDDALRRELATLHRQTVVLLGPRRTRCELGEALPVAWRRAATAKRLADALDRYARGLPTLSPAEEPRVRAQIAATFDALWERLVCEEPQPGS